MPPRVELTNAQKFSFRARFRGQPSGRLYEPVGEPLVTVSNPVLASVSRQADGSYEVRGIAGQSGEASIVVSATVNPEGTERGVSGTINIAVTEAGAIEVVSVEFEIGPVVNQ